MNYSELKADLLAQIGRAPSDLCYKLVTASINADLRVEGMVASHVYSTPAASQDLPAGFLEAKSLYLDVGEYRRAIPLVGQSHFDRVERVSGHSIMASVVGSNLFLNPVEGGTLTLYYFAKLDDLSDDTDTNTILTDHPSVYVYGTLAHHNALIRSPQAQTYFAAFQEAMREAKRADVAKKTGGLTAAPMPRVAP